MAETMTVGSDSWLLRMYASAEKPLTPGILRSRNSRSASGFASTTSCKVARLSASFISAPSTQFLIA